MQLEKVITLANAAARLRFLAMERSLRSTGCDLPLWVIPYDDNLFPLPPNSEWWVVPEVLEWLRARRAHRMMSKYQCLTERNYQFVDSDIVFLRNPAEVLAGHQGFIASCGQWRDAEQAVTPESRLRFQNKCTLWQRNVFNAGQFACDRILFEPHEVIATIQRPDLLPICLEHPRDPFFVNDQTGLNMLVQECGVPMINLNLPPSEMESTWAGDYEDEDFRHCWNSEARTPYLIHWAGVPMNTPRPIHQLFFQHLTPTERDEWNAQVQRGVEGSLRGWTPGRIFRRLKRGAKAFLQE